MAAQHNLANASCLTVSSWRGNIRPGTKNGVKGAQLESTKERERQGRICVSFQEKKNLGQTSTGREVFGTWWEVVRWREGFIKIWLGLGTTQHGYKSTFAIGDTSYKGWAAQGLVLQSTLTSPWEVPVLFKFSTRGSIRVEEKIPA